MDAEEPARIRASGRTRIKDHGRESETADQLLFNSSNAQEGMERFKVSDKEYGSGVGFVRFDGFNNGPAHHIVLLEVLSQ